MSLFWPVLFLLLFSPGIKSNEQLTAEEIVERAHQAAGGAEWVQPRTLYLSGSSIFYEGTSRIHMDKHEMWRIYESRKASAHEATGNLSFGMRPRSNELIAIRKQVRA